MTELINRRFVNAAVKDCCKDDANLGAVEPLGADLSFRRCQVCQCRHFTGKADPVQIGVKTTGIGQKP